MVTIIDRQAKKATTINTVCNSLDVYVDYIGECVVIKKLTQDFEEQNMLLKNLIHIDADIGAIKDVDSRIQNIVDSIRKLHVVTNEDITIQMKFFIRLALPKQEDNSLAGYSNTLENLIDRYHGSVQKLAPNPVKRTISNLLKQG